MKLLFVAWRDLANDLAGGSEVLIDRLASELAGRGHDVALMCAHPVERRPYAVMPNGGRIDQFARAPLTYARNFRDRDLVVDVANGMAFFAPLWRRGPSLCFVNHIHTEQWEQWFPRPVAALGRSVERQLMPRVYRERLFVSVSPSTTEGLIDLGVRPSQVRTIINGTDLPMAAGVESAEPLFVSLGRMVPHKRLDIMLRAWNRVRPNTGGRLVLIGDGPDRARLEGLAGEGVVFVGKISEADKQRLLAKAWFLVHTASHEGWGLVVMEAAAHGTPTVAFRVAGIRDSVAPGVSGELVENEDQLVRRWIELAGATERRARLRKGARDRAAAFTWTATVDSFLEIAEEAIERHRHPDKPASRRFQAVTPKTPAVATPFPQAPTLKTPGRDTLDPFGPSTPDDDDPLLRSPLAGVEPDRPSSAPVETGLATVHRLVIRAEEQPALTVVVPAFNERARLPFSMPPMLAGLPSGTELIVVDDGSSDATRQVAEGLLTDTPASRVISLSAHRGKGAAVRAGVEVARGRTIAFMDADLATDLKFLDPLLAALDGHHIAIGSRSAPGAVTNGWTPSQDAAHRSFNQLSRVATGLAVSDFQCGFKAFRAPVAKLLFHLLEEEGFAFDVELLALADRIGYRINELPVHWQAVRGSHTRIVVDSGLMAMQVTRIGLRNRRGRRLASLEAFARQGAASDPQQLTVQVQRQLGLIAPVVPWKQGALALLPFVEPGDSPAVAATLQDRLPDLVVRPSTFDAGTLFEPSAHRLRTALAAS